MELLGGYRVLASPGMQERPLARYFESLGAEVICSEPDSSELASASFFIEDLGLPRLEELGLSRAALARLNPGLIHVSVTTFGSYGPHARWRGGEFVTSAMGGVLRLTGEPDRPPVKEALDACLFHADMVAAAGAMAAHYSRGLSGLGQHVDISAQEVAFSRIVNSILVWQFDRRKLHRVGGAVNYGKATVRCIWKLADGWCFHTLMTGRFGAPANKSLSDWMDEVGARNPMREVDWLQYNRSTLDPALRADWEAAMAEFFATRSRAEIRGEGRKRGINACVLAAPADVLLDPHLRARSFWAERDGLRFPSRFAALRPGPPPTDAPRAPPARVTSGAMRRGPLTGVRVLDFSWALVGSITTKVLGDLGAEVIKIESRARPCLSRLDVQVAASRAGDFDDKPWFAHLNTSKRSVELDMKRPGALELLQPLIDWADVVVENFSPGTMAKLGLDYDTLVRRNPSLVMVSGSVYGQTGPLAQEWGVDGTGAALSGRTYLTGWADRGPVMPGAVPYGDVIVPYVMAATVAAALESRRRTGVGTHIDASMYEICVQQMFDAIQGAQTGTPPARIGNYSPGTFWQAVLPAAGVDRWVAVTVADKREWQLLLALAGNTDLAGWSAKIPDHVLAELLQARGIAAGVVQDVEDLMERDAGLRARGALVELDHARLGRFGHVRTPIDFSVDVPRPFRAPSIGEHTREVLLEIAGVEPSQRSRKDLTCTAAATTYQKEYIAELRRRVIEAGEPFVIAQADTPHEIFHAMDIPLVSNQWWSAYISAKRLSGKYFRAMDELGYPSNRCRYCSLGLACTLAGDKKTAPWGGLPRPTVLVARLTCDCVQEVFSQWAQALQTDFFALEAPAWEEKQPDWYLHSRQDWEKVFQQNRISLLVEEMRELIALLERKTGRGFELERLTHLMEKINEQEGYIAEAAEMVATARPCPVTIVDQMPNTMIPQWHRGSDWAVAHARRFRDEVAERVREGVGVAANERLRLMWIGAGLWHDTSFYRALEEKWGAVFVWSMYMPFAGPQYIREIRNRPMEALASRICSMNEVLHLPPWMNGWMVSEAQRFGIDAAVMLIPPDNRLSQSGTKLTAEALREAGVPVLTLHADMVDDERWSHEAMVTLVENFLRQEKLIPSSQI